MKTLPCTLLMTLLLACLLALPVTAAAQEPAPAPEGTPIPTTPPPAEPPPVAKKVPVWTGAVEAGATATSGNTQVETYTAAAKADGKWRGWGLAYRSSVVYAETRNIQTAGAFDASLRGDRKLVGPLSAYARISIDGDRFKGINNRKGAGAGLGVEIWKRPAEGYVANLLRAEAGYQYYREDLARTEEDHDIHGARGFLAFLHAFSKDAVFTEEVEALSDLATEDRYLVTSVTALTMKLRTNIAFKVSETVKIDTKPNFIAPEDESLGRFERVDTITTAAVIVSF